MLRRLSALAFSSLIFAGGDAVAEPQRVPAAPAPKPTVIPAPVPVVVPPSVANGRGVITGVTVTGYNYPDAGGTITVQGHGMCMLRVATYSPPIDKNHPLDYELFQTPVKLPFTTVRKRGPAVGGGDHMVEIITLGQNADGTPTDITKKQFPTYLGCSLPPLPPNKWALEKMFPTWPFGTKPPANPNAPNASNGGGGAPGGGGGGGPLPGQPKPATGKITLLQVPGGSFAEDDPQKLQVSGTGGCAFDLEIKRTDAQGGFDKTWPVNPMSLDGQPLLYNGTHFDTLAEASYNAKVTGKNGCTGTATIDFKVTPKNTTKTIHGQPTLTTEKKPIAGSAFTKSKDSNIWFVVKVPQAVKDEPYAGCCDVEFNYRNAYGGWEVLPGSPFSDASWGLAITQSSASVPKSVSGFTQGTQWRMKVRAYKFKTQFDWSDWLEFQVDQN